MDAPAAADPPPHPPPPPIPEGKARLYVGKGRTVVDDPSRYPDRTELTGGWAGGEVGLKRFAAEAAAAGGDKAGADKKAGVEAAVKKSKGSIYVGNGRFIDDDPAKYADKETLAGFTNVTGGFAGGERGVKAFAASGSLEIAPPGAPGSPQFSPLAFAFGLAAVAAGGGVLLNSGVVEVETIAAGGAALPSAPSLPADPSSRAALVTGAAGFAVLGGIVGVRAAVMGAKARAASLAASIGDAAKAAAFWVALFFAAKLVLENS